MLTIEEAYEELFQDVLCGIVQICFPLGTELKLYRINPKAERLLGIEAGESPVCIPASHYMDPDNLKYAGDVFGRLRKEGDKQPFLLQLYNGVIEGMAEYIYTPEGTPVIQVLFLELGEEIAIRRREAAQKELLERVMDAVHCGVVRFGYSGDEEQILLVNRAGWVLLGFESEEQCITQGLNGFLARIHPEDQKVFLRAHYTLNRENEKKGCEFRIQNGDGWQWLAAEQQQLRDAAGKQVVQMTLMDINARMQLVKRQQEESGEIINSLGTIYLIVLYVDTALDRYRIVKGAKQKTDFPYTGIYSEDLRNMAQRRDPEHAADWCRSLSIENMEQQFLEGRSFLEEEFQVSLGSGAYAYYHVEAVLFGDQGRLSHVTLGLRDVTGQRIKEIKEHEALQSAYRAETQANRAKTDFLSRMSHDIRTPMNAIVGLSELMRMDLKDSEKLTGYLDQIDSASQILLGLINDVLDMNRIESGQVRLSLQNFDLRALIDQIRLLVEPQMQAKNHQFTVKVDLPAGTYTGDPNHIRQILTNLLSNAIKFTPDGGRIALEAFGEPSGTGITFTVSDNGQGMSEAFQKRIFEPFEREEEQIQGSGLGMAIVSSLVHLMNGWIEIQSALHKGSTFRIFLPLAAAEEPGNPVQRVQQSERPQQGPDLSGRHVLVAEDNAVNSMIACRLLEKLGAKVTAAENGLEALRAFEDSEEGWFDLILMDVRMPKLNGYEAARKLRSLERGDAATIPIVAMTANAFSEDVHSALEAGMNEHFAKPIQLGAFYEMLGRWLKAPEQECGGRKS